MDTPLTRLFTTFETHSVEGIRASLDSGLDARMLIDGKSAVNHLIEMYFRSVPLMRLLLAAGARADLKLQEA